MSVDGRIHFMLWPNATQRGTSCTNCVLAQLPQFHSLLFATVPPRTRFQVANNHCWSSFWPSSRPFELGSTQIYRYVATKVSTSCNSRQIIDGQLHHLTESVQQFRSILEVECSNIFALHSIRIPCSYRLILQHLARHINSEFLVDSTALYQELRGHLNVDQQTVQSALHFLHSIGRIVLLSSGMVCTNPGLVPQIAAKFISPEDVQCELLKRETENVQILDKAEVGCLLQIDSSNNKRYLH